MSLIASRVHSTEPVEYNLRPASPSHPPPIGATFSLRADRKRLSMETLRLHFTALPGRWLAAALLLAGCAPAGEPDPPIGFYSGGTIARSEYESWLSVQKPDDVPELLDALTTIAIRKHLAAAARSRGVEETLRVRLALEELETRALERAFRRHLAAGIELEPGELERAVEERKDRFGLPRRLELRNLFKSFRDGMTAGERAALWTQMEELRRRLEAGADFAALAARESDSQTRFRGGLIGVVRPGDLDPGVEEVAMSLRPGELSEVLETADGLTLLRCERVLEATEPDLDTIRVSIEQRLRKERMAERMAELRAELLAGVRLDLDAAQLVSTPGETRVVELPDGGGLTLEEVQMLMRLRRARRAPADLPRERLRQILEGMVLDRRQAARARELGLAEEPELESRLHWRRLETLAREEMGSRVQERWTPPSEEEARARYDADPERYRHPEELDLAVIMLRADRTNVRERYRRAEALSADLAAGRIAFDEAARQFSEHPSASRGGRLGWLSRRRMAPLGPLVAKTALGLEPGETSELVQQTESLIGDSTLWILRLLDDRGPRPMSFEEARAGVLGELGRERRQAIRRQLRQQLVSELAVRAAGGPAEGSAAPAP